MPDSACAANRSAGLSLSFERPGIKTGYFLFKESGHERSKPAGAQLRVLAPLAPKGTI